MGASAVGRRVEQQLILDRYRPLEHLGEGAFGAVVLAWDTRMQRRVAIKRMSLPLDEQGRPHQPPGLSEARTAAMLNHPNIATVFDFDTDADEAFIIMEHVDGASLADILADLDDDLSLDEATAVIMDTSCALEYAHANGILHLDIKPENILVARDGRAKVADFGMAELSSLSGHGPAFGGTAGYMPLEQLQGAPVSERTDEWALAALAFELLTGDNPFAADSVEDAVMHIEVLDPPLPSEYGRSLPAEIDDILLGALGPYPADRYPSVAEFTGRLEPYLGDATRGRESLSEIVEGYWEDEEQEPGTLREVGLWDRLQGRLGAALMRLAASAEAAWLAWAGLAPFELERLPYLGAIGLVAVAAAFAPGLGIGLGLGCFVAGLLAASAWVMAGIVLVAGGAWWWFVARRSASASVLPLSAPVLALARLSFAQPLLAGFALTPVRAALTALFGGTLTMLASAASAQGPPYLVVWPGYALDVWNVEIAAFSIRTLLLSPAALMALLGWPAAAAFMSLMCSRATRAGAVLGAVGGSAVLGVSYLLADRISRPMTSGGTYEGGVLGLTLGASLILVTLVALLGPPLRGEEEDAFALSETETEDD